MTHAHANLLMRTWLCELLYLVLPELSSREQPGPRWHGRLQWAQQILGYD